MHRCTIGLSSDRMIPVGTLKETRKWKLVGNRPAGWLRAFLADGPKPAKEVRAAAARRGIAYPTLRRARKVLGVALRKEGKTWVRFLDPEGSSAP